MLEQFRTLTATCQRCGAPDPLTTATSQMPLPPSGTEREPNPVITWCFKCGGKTLVRGYAAKRPSSDVTLAFNGDSYEPVATEEYDNGYLVVWQLIKKA